MINNFTINTGEPRHIVGHAVSGAVAVGIVSSISNIQDVKNAKIGTNEAIRETLKDSLLGAVATATAISVANSLGDPRKSIFQTIGSLVLGGGAIYTIEKASKIKKQELIENKKVTK